MTGREDDTGRTLRSLLLEESNAIPVDTHQTAVHLRRRIADIRKRRRLTFAAAASVVVVLVIVAGGWLGVNKAAEPVQNPDQPVAIAQEFVNAVGRFDADAAISNLSDDASVKGDLIAPGSNAAEQLRLTLAHYRAAAYKQSFDDCVYVGTTVPGWMAAGASVSCAFDMQAIRSEEIGLDPYTGNVWRITVRDGKIVSALQNIPYGANGFRDQIWVPFATWMSTYHPGDVLTMFPNDAYKRGRLCCAGAAAPLYTEDSNRLWEQRSAEYVAAVKLNPATLLNQPQVGAYVAKLDSICAAAQTKFENRIKAISPQNQPAITDARKRVLRETMPALRAAPSPEAVHWSYEGRAFPLIENFYSYPRNVQPPESLQGQIQQIPGLNKCMV
jgi:hypothetical protein